MPDKNLNPYCKIPGCGKLRQDAHAICSGCRGTARRRARGIPVLSYHPLCTWAGCRRRHVAKGYCSKHYMHLRRHAPGLLKVAV